MAPYISTMIAQSAGSYSARVDGGPQAALIQGITMPGRRTAARTRAGSPDRSPSPTPAGSAPPAATEPGASRSPHRESGPARGAALGDWARGFRPHEQASQVLPEAARRAGAGAAPAERGDGAGAARDGRIAGAGTARARRAGLPLSPVRVGGPARPAGRRPGH